MNVMSKCIEKLRRRFPQDGRQLFQLDKSGELRATIAAYHVVQNEQMTVYFTTGELMTILDAARLKCFRAGAWGKDLMGCRNFKELAMACHTNKGEIVGRILAAADYGRLYPEVTETSKLWRSQDLTAEESAKYEEGILKMAAIYHLAPYACKPVKGSKGETLDARSAVHELSGLLDREKTLNGNWLEAVEKKTVEEVAGKWATSKPYDGENPPLRPTFQSVRQAVRPWGSEEPYEEYLARAPFSQYALKKNAERWRNLPPHVARERMTIIPQATAYALDQYMPVIPVYAEGYEFNKDDEEDLFNVFDDNENAKLEGAHTSSLVMTIDQAVHKFSAIQDKALVQFHVPERLWRDSVTLRKEMFALADRRGCEVSDDLMDEVLRQWQERGKNVDEDAVRLVREGLASASTSLESMAREQRLKREAMVEEGEGEEIAWAVVERDDEDWGMKVENRPNLDVAEEVKMRMADVLDMIQGETMAVNMLIGALKAPQTPFPEPLKRVVLETLEERDEQMARTFLHVHEALQGMAPMSTERVPCAEDLKTPAGRERAAMVIGGHLIEGTSAKIDRADGQKSSGQTHLPL
jgi:hypothetical protein